MHLRIGRGVLTLSHMRTCDVNTARLLGVLHGFFEKRLSTYRRPTDPINRASVIEASLEKCLFDQSRTTAASADRSLDAVGPRPPCFQWTCGEPRWSQCKPKCGLTQQQAAACCSQGNQSKNVDVGADFLMTINHG